MSADVDRLMDNLRIRVPGATDGALRLELFNVLVDFTSETNVWRADIALPVIAGVRDYVIVQEGVSYINQLIQVTDHHGWGVNATMAVPGEIFLINKPSEDAEYNAEVGLVVSDPVTRDDYPVLPDWIWSKYAPDFLDGVQAAMFSQIAKPYSNERMAIFHMRKFADAKARARVEARHKNTYDTQRWRFPQTFAVRRR